MNSYLSSLFSKVHLIAVKSCFVNIPLFIFYPFEEINKYYFMNYLCVYVCVCVYISICDPGHKTSHKGQFFDTEICPHLNHLKA